MINVCSWHLAEIEGVSPSVPFWGKADIVCGSHNDPKRTSRPHQRLSVIGPKRTKVDLGHNGWPLVTHSRRPLRRDGYFAKILDLFPIPFGLYRFDPNGVG
jgi:hypothetical protein